MLLNVSQAYLQTQVLSQFYSFSIKQTILSGKDTLLCVYTTVDTSVYLLHFLLSLCHCKTAEDTFCGIFPPVVSGEQYPANALVNTTVAAECTKGKFIFAMAFTYC